MKLGQVNKFDKGNITASKKFDDDGVSAIYYVIVLFTIYG